MKTEIKYGKKLTNKFIKRIFLWTSIYTFIFIILWLLCRSICSSVIWYEGDFFYDILRNIGYSFTTLLIIWLIGFSIIVIKCLYKTLSYVDSIVDASALLISDKEEDIVLPEDLLDVEKRMNQIKKQARKNLRLAQENEQRKNDLIVYLAHDIKTPLTSMIGYLSLLNETNNIYQIDISFDENYMYGKILSDKESTIDYKIVNGNLNYIKENNKIYECVEVIRIEIDKKTKKEIKKEKLYDEKVLIKYELPSDVKVEEM